MAEPITVPGVYDMPAEVYHAGWDRHTFVAGTGQGDGWGNRTEVLWSNRPLGRQMALDLAGAR